MDNNLRSRYFNILLYPESQQAVIDNLIENYNCAGILHDKDKFTQGEHKGEFKKPHFHFVVKFENARHLSGLAKELEIDERFIEICKSFKSSAMYLLHYGKSEKYQYSSDDLVGYLKNDVLKLLEGDKPESVLVCEVVAMVEEINSYLSYSAFAVMCCQNGYWSVVRRSQNYFNALLKEHNLKYSKCNDV